MRKHEISSQCSAQLQGLAAVAQPEYTIENKSLKNEVRYKFLKKQRTVNEKPAVYGVH